MRFATFNLYQYLAPPDYWYEKGPGNTYTLDAWKQKRKWIRTQLIAMNADVVAFQEVFSAADLRALVKKAGYPYFAVASQDLRDPEDEQIHIAPRVALASRVPLTGISELQADTLASQALGFNEDFQFSRVPLAAIVQMPGVGPVRVIATHLKSKRSADDDAGYKKRTPWKQRAASTLQTRSLGKIISLRQRGAEATLLYRNIVDQLVRDPDIPQILMGDLNDHENSLVLDSLLMRDRIFRIGIEKRDKWPAGLDAVIHGFRLTDAFRDAPSYQTQIRPHTHVFSGSPGTVDYVLFTNHFNRRNPDRVARVSSFEVLNEHLEPDGVGQSRQSDHGQVVVEFRPTLNAEKPTISSEPSDVQARSGLSRSAFIALCGGVYESRDSWRNWRGSDKYDNYWAFYFDKEYGWVKSVYGRVPVSELYQKQRYSIEHIVPRSFLNAYLKSRGAAQSVRYGAVVNPLNFAAAERGLNSARSSFAFDMDGDEVVRPFRLDLNPSAYGTTGLDNDNEWVIPSISRGKIARAILYMVMTYGIDELYNRHLDTLVHWAKVDPVTPWELAFNAWVHGRFGIRNPFVDEPSQANQYLDDRALLESVLVK